MRVGRHLGDPCCPGKAPLARVPVARVAALGVGCAQSARWRAARREARVGHRHRAVRRAVGTRRCDQGGPPADRRRGRDLHVLPIRLGHGADHGQGDPGQALGDDRSQGVPARLRLDRQPVRRPRGELHRVRARSAGARRPPRRRDVLRAPLGSEDREGLLHAVPRARGRGRRRRVPDVGLPRQPQADPRRVHGGDRAASAGRDRARDDVAEDQPRRHAVGRRQDQAVLLPHRPVLGAPADHPQGDGVRRPRWVST